MAMVRQVTEGEIINDNTAEEDSQSSDHVGRSNSQPPSESSSGSKRTSPALMPSLQYSKEELMKISTCPQAQKWPKCLDPAYNNSSGKWDPERWFMLHRCVSLEEPRSKRDEGILNHKRKSSDPKERIKDEKDDIVLSPQRRSFGTGCHVIQQSSLARRPGSPTEPENFRRIGSGRIMARDQREWERDRDYGYRRDRFDQEDNEKDLRRYSNRYNRDRRSRGRDRIDEVEPEWFSGGPTSQSETIELVGFEENDDDSRKPQKKSAAKRAKQNSRRSSLKSEEGEKTDDAAKKGHREEGKEESGPSNAGFDLDDLFRMDWVPGLVESPPESAGSRFSQFFQRESPERRSSEELIANVLNSIGEPPDIMAMLKNNVPTNGGQSCEELEAGLKRIVLGEKKERSAFDKLLQHMSSDSPAISMGPIDKSKALQEQDLLHDIDSSRPAYVHQPELFLLQQQQGFTVDMLAKILGTSAQPAAPNRNDPHALNAAIQYQRQRELLSSLLKQSQRRCPSAKDLQLGVPTLGISPRQSPLPPEIPSQGRIPSPLVFGQQPPALSHAPAPIHPGAFPQNAANPNTLQVQNPVVMQRVPSPQELAVHTQTILHNALIKRKLEEQKENFRKRTSSPVPPNKNGTSVSPIKGLSPNLAFTPSSVIRKLQSEKAENKEQKPSPAINKPVAQSIHSFARIGTTEMTPRPILPGRPIVKVGNRTPEADFSWQFGQRQPNFTPMSHRPLLRPVAPPPQASNYPFLRNMIQTPMRNPSNINYINQLAALHRRDSMDARQILSQGQRLHPAALQLLMSSQSQAAGFPGNRDHQANSSRQSPVNLTKWFGNDVLKQKMPEMPPMTHQKALLVEELERQHN